MRSRQLVLTCTLAVCSAACAGQAVSPPLRPMTGTEGCYRADRPLGTSAGSALGRGVPAPVGPRIGEDSASLPGLATFRLGPGGRVERPGTVLQTAWARRSEWTASGDTLNVTLSTGTSGWALRLTRARGNGDDVYTGIARYLTDVIVRDTAAWQPPQHVIQVRQEGCIP